MRYGNALPTFALLAGLLLGGCADEGDTAGSGSTTGSSPEATETFNDADVAFATNMIPHHRQAIEMAGLAEERSQDSEVKELAANIQAAQQPEIDTMSGWLQAWGKPVPDVTGGMAGMDHGGMTAGEMPDMMTAEEMNQLRNQTGVGFDRMFLTMMIAHHEGAIRMAETEQANGSNPDAVALAKKIAEDQQAEIETINRLLGR